jgi:hypothetical protein
MSSFWQQAAATASQARCDAIQAEYRAEQRADPSIRREPPPRPSIRRENPPPMPAALVPTDDLLKLRLAEELEYVRRIIENMGDTCPRIPLW